MVTLATHYKGLLFKRFQKGSFSHQDDILHRTERFMILTVLWMLTLRLSSSYVERREKEKDNLSKGDQNQKHESKY